MLVCSRCRNGTFKFITHIYLHVQAFRSVLGPDRSFLTKSQSVLIDYVEIDAGIKALVNANLYLIGQVLHTHFLSLSDD